MEKPDNIDINEIEKFSSNADEWWDENGVFKTLHDINPVRLQFITDNITLNNISVLDIGCGGGILSEAMAAQNANVTGLDASHENIDTARQHASANNIDINYQTGNAEDYSMHNQNAFDLITCMELLEHVPDPVSIIKSCVRMIKPGGHVIFSTLNRNPKSYLFAVIAAEYLLKLLPTGMHQYKNFIRPSELVHWCNEAGLELNDLKGMSFNPILKTCSLTNKPDVNYLIDTIAR